MRTFADRLRHTISFELIGLAICTPIAAWVLGRGFGEIGTMTVFISVSAMMINYVYNLAFDHALLKMGRPLNVRPPWMRAVHTVLFEATLLLMTIPFIAWWLGMTMWHAFVTDISFVLFYLVYAYVFNWTYDQVFPIPVENER